MVLFLFQWSFLELVVVISEIEDLRISIWGDKF